MYPYGYEDELSRKRAPKEQLASEEILRGELVETISPIQDFIHSMGSIAIAATVGIAGAGFKDKQTISTLHPEQSPTTITHARALGSVSLHHLVEIEQGHSALNERAVLGYAERQAA